MTVWQEVVDQEDVVEQLKLAVIDVAKAKTNSASAAFTQTWLITGPPGSGRSTAARAFAAAIQCESNGCGSCKSCSQVLSNSHPDVQVVAPSGLTIGVEETRDLIQRAFLEPSIGNWQIFVIEDADRLTVPAANALLKILEEPPTRTFFLLCAPAAEDVLPTIKSRSRHLGLRLPRTNQVAQLLVTRNGIEPELANFVAKAALGHVGVAKALATNTQARERREQTLKIPLQLDSLPACFVQAQLLYDSILELVDEVQDERDEAEQSELLNAFGAGTEGVKKGRVEYLARSAMKELKDDQKSKRTRAVRDQLDRSLQDLLSLYRDVLFVQLGVEVELINDELRSTIERLAKRATPTATRRALDAIQESRAAISASANPLLVLESLLINLARTT
ncbi:MAG: hypothetical protein RIT32_1052 [Actinomycetota bacterium]|jgi:DNA polymerase-3 subunit delta'